MFGKRITSLKDLDNLQRELIGTHKDVKARVLICMTGCRALGSLAVAEEFRAKLKSSLLDKQVEVVETGCIGLCAGAPVILIEPYQFLYGGITPEDIEEIIVTTIQNGKAVERLAVAQNEQNTA
ncbi:MAG: (2Fe-2S) ferredoxin domain-containing protein [Planctomycetota bacterium]|jgi:(2Fe-2S) ferredoxin